MPVVRRTIAYRKSRRLRKLDDDDDLWEQYDAALLNASLPPLSAPEVDAEPASVPLVVSPPQTEPTLHVALDVGAELDVEDEVQPRDVTPGGHIPRPRNAFIFFRSAYVQRAKEQALLDSRGVSMNQKTLSADAGSAWRALPPAQRAPFWMMAQREKDAHAKKYPGYQYTPRGAGSVERTPRKRSTPRPTVRIIANVPSAASTSTSIPKYALKTADAPVSPRPPSTTGGKMSSVIDELDSLFSDALALEKMHKHDDGDYTPNPFLYPPMLRARKPRSKSKFGAPKGRQSPASTKSKSAMSSSTRSCPRPRRFFPPPAVVAPVEDVKHIQLAVDASEENKIQDHTNGKTCVDAEMPAAPALRLEPVLVPNSDDREKTPQLNYTQDDNVKNIIPYSSLRACSYDLIPTQFGCDSSSASSSSLQFCNAAESSASPHAQSECVRGRDWESCEDEETSLPPTASPFLRSSAPSPSPASSPLRSDPTADGPSLFLASPKPTSPSVKLEWDAWIYTPIELPSDDEFEFVGAPSGTGNPDFSEASKGWKAVEWAEKEDTRFATPSPDYGFFYPLDLDGDCSVLRELDSAR